MTKIILVDKESFNRGGQMISLVFIGDHMQVYEIAVHLSLARWRIPSTEDELLKTRVRRRFTGVR
jgi:hypothetical protein